MLEFDIIFGNFQTRWTQTSFPEQLLLSRCEKLEIPYGIQHRRLHVSMLCSYGIVDILMVSLKPPSPSREVSNSRSVVRELKAPAPVDSR